MTEADRSAHFAENTEAEARRLVEELSVAPNTMMGSLMQTATKAKDAAMSAVSDAAKASATAAKATASAASSARFGEPPSRRSLTAKIAISGQPMQSWVKTVHCMSLIGKTSSLVTCNTTSETPTVTMNTVEFTG